ncbi:MAG: hypothetical protein A6F71_10955 [Cycloclasticus sp. symbiont of Poecilosclerida sp. M]|nr:MAG: hypothetical protein A6F71_10955 [Cycloclasticus sp. symbiont of Poecilosclerida sp. M]
MKKNPTLLHRSESGDVIKTQFPENWVELVGVAESLEQYSRDEIRRQEVTCTYLHRWYRLHARDWKWVS